MPRKRKHKANSAILQDFANQVMAENRDGKFLLNPQGEISMSDAISELMEPYKADAPDYNSFSNLVTFACIAWNTSVLPENQRNEALSKMVDVIPGKMEDRLEILGLLTELMERKRKLFPNVSRVIIEHKVTDREAIFTSPLLPRWKRRIQKNEYSTSAAGVAAAVTVRYGGGIVCAAAECFR